MGNNEVQIRRSNKTCPTCGAYVQLAVVELDEPEEDGSTHLYRYECMACGRATDIWTKITEVREDFLKNGWAYRIRNDGRRYDDA